MLAGGVEEFSTESSLAFNAAGLLCPEGQLPRPFDPTSPGTTLSEGAALLVIEDGEAAGLRGARVEAEVSGHGCAFDPSRRRDDQRSILSIVRSMRLALRQAGLGPDDIDVVSASASGVRRIDRHEAMAIAEVFGSREILPPISAVKAVLGESLGAAGPLQCAVMIEAMRSGFVPATVDIRKSLGQEVGTGLLASPTRHVLRTGLINSLSSDGHSCSLVLSSVSA